MGIKTLTRTRWITHLVISLELLSLDACGNKNVSTTNIPFQPTPQPTIQPTNTQLVPPLIDIADGGFLSRRPCGPPCFMGMQPGVTAENDVLDFLQDKTDLSLCHVWDTRVSSGDRGIKCGNLTFTFLDSNVIDMIAFVPSENISVEEVIAVYGEPDGIFVGHQVDSSGNVVSVHLDMYYIKINTVVGLPEQQNEIYKVTKATSINGIIYREDSNYEKYYLLGSQTWNGYTEYNPSPIP